MSPLHCSVSLCPPIELLLFLLRTHSPSTLLHYQFGQRYCMTIAMGAIPLPDLTFALFLLTLNLLTLYSPLCINTLPFLSSTPQLPLPFHLLRKHLPWHLYCPGSGRGWQVSYCLVGLDDAFPLYLYSQCQNLAILEQTTHPGHC